MMRRSVGLWVLIPVALMLFAFVFAAGSGTVVAQASPVTTGSGAAVGQAQTVSTPGTASTAAVVAATGNPFAPVLPTQARATGPGGIVYGQYQPRRLRDG